MEDLLKIFREAISPAEDVSFNAQHLISKQLQDEVSETTRAIVEILNNHEIRKDFYQILCLQLWKHKQ